MYICKFLYAPYVFNSISLLHDQLGLHMVWQVTKTCGLIVITLHITLLDLAQWANVRSEDVFKKSSLKTF